MLERLSGGTYLRRFQGLLHKSGLTENGPCGIERGEKQVRGARGLRWRGMRP